MKQITVIYLQQMRPLLARKTSRVFKKCQCGLQALWIEAPRIEAHI